ncbi:response regulator [Saccharothrix syringae]|uniref:Response regulator transcription factor n=1 Tax=Saccharothrix syringae TaxID=103733 RepID=A0A5Q0GYE1_SACSY|nr:response regulator transcription factor [Saccharothrix syringae]QFZ18524.1 response regulator transcription factor [Saccharothrix syringae]
MTTIRVLVADDQALVREGLVVLLAIDPDIEVIGEAADGHDAVRLAAELRPDVVLMDVRMPVLDGLEATRRIMEAPANEGTVPAKVLVLTTYDLDEYVYRALRAGASGFLLKDSPATTLRHAVRVIAAGDALLAPSVTRRLITEFAQLGTHRVPIGAAPNGLTERETEVLVLIATGRSNTEIAETLVLAEQTVKTHVSRILTKLGLRDRAQAVVYAYETGLVRPAL